MLFLKRNFLLILFCMAATVQAKVPRLNNAAPIQIQSDIASFEQRNHQAVHEGNVVMIQGDNIVHADKLFIKKDPKGELSVIKAMGNPATFTGVFDDDPKPVLATAKVIFYYPDKQLIVLEGAATLDHHEDKFKGPMLSYQIDKQIVSATKQSDERPTITIHPRMSKR